MLWNGGPQVLALGTLPVIAGALAQSASLAEMASIQPIAGAQYHWTHFLAPPRHRRFITWMQGWLPSTVTELYPMMLTTFRQTRLGDLVCLGITSCGSLQHFGCNDSRANRTKLPELRSTAMASYLFNHHHAHRRIPDEHVHLLGDPLDRIVGRYPSRHPLHHLCRGLGCTGT